MDICPLFSPLALDPGRINILCAHADVVSGGKSDYCPLSIDTLSASGFDYAALVACMLRTQGVRCKLVIGYADSYYHAWNEVLLDEKWTRYDTTSMASGLKVVSYTTERVY